ncbi:flagellar hook-length control protein FliK [Erwinia sp. V71]|uniref:flagellar hook-length control protein FliK n=1 Tax=Erwinia sp. V71 TaxID=3369424 RepID=UPI003F5E89D9
MITLPTLPTTATASSDAGVDATATGDSLLAAGETPKEFLTLLGNRLLSLVQQSGTDKAQLKTDAASDKEETPAGELNALLAALEQPETLNSLLQTENVKGDSKSADDKDSSKIKDLTDSDMQTLQALFAMLPQNSVQPLTANASQSQLQSSISDLSKSANSQLNALSAALNSLNGKTAATDSDATINDDAGAKLASASSVVDSKNASLVSPVLTSSNSETSSTSSTSSASTALQQALSSMSKEENKEQTVSPSSVTTLSTAAAAVAGSTTAISTPTASATTQTPATSQLNAQLGSPEWQQALSQQVLMFTRNGQQNAELRLHPQDLGSIQISLKLDNDQAQLSMVSGHSQVRAALEAALPQLRTALAESGINLGQSNVSSDSLPQSSSFSGQQESRRDGSSGNSSFASVLEGDSEITPIAVPAALQARAAGSSAVDIFA